MGLLGNGDEGGVPSGLTFERDPAGQPKALPGDFSYMTVLPAPRYNLVAVVLSQPPCRSGRTYEKEASSQSYGGRALDLQPVA